MNIKQLLDGAMLLNIES